MSWLTWLLASRHRLGLAAAAAALLAIGAYITVLKIQLRRAETEVRINRLAFLNMEAHADTTRVLFEDQARQLRAVTRLAEQRKVEGDARLAEHDRQASARADLELQVDSLHRLIQRPSIDSSDVRISTFDSDAADSADGNPSPFHIRATVRQPRPPAPASWDVTSRLDPAAVTLELACQGDHARADVVGPSWLRIRLARIQQSSDVCHTPVQSTRRRRVAFGGGVGVGVVRDLEGWHAGPGAWLGVSIAF